MKKYNLNNYKWKLKNSDNPFRAYIVQPYSAEISNEEAEKLFFETINFLERGNFKSVIYDSNINPIESTYTTNKIPEKYKLLTFPEGFLPYSILINFLKSDIPDIGCIHTGLRTERNKDFLFYQNDVSSLIKELENLVFKKDIDKFKNWYIQNCKDEQPISLAIFLLKENKKGKSQKENLRICLHPKIVRSKYENSYISEEHLKECGLLSLIYLEQKNNIKSNIITQPLICSDLISKPKDLGLLKPVEAEELSNHLFDIVSTVNCSPTMKKNILDPSNNDIFTWKLDFKNIFSDASKGEFNNRFQNTCFILTNYFKFPNISTSNQGGLSGFFISKISFNDILALSSNEELQVEIFCRPNSETRPKLLTELGAHHEDGWISGKIVKELNLDNSDFSSISGAFIMKSNKNIDNHIIFSFKLNNLPRFITHNNNDKNFVFNFYKYQIEGDEYIWK